MRAIPRRWKAAAIAAGVVVVVGTGYGWAAITETNNVYTGCLGSGAITNVAVGSDPLKPCQKASQKISWSQTGPQGTPGTNVRRTAGGSARRGLATTPQPHQHGGRSPRRPPSPFAQPGSQSAGAAASDARHHKRRGAS
jgi:hypothetical protein